MKPKIFAFINGNRGTDLIDVVALSEDGHVLAKHCSSSEDWAKHDIGINSDWNHDHYNKHYPDGYELVWVENAKEDDGLLAAHGRHIALFGQE